MKQLQVICRACGAGNDSTAAICHRCGISMDTAEPSRQESAIICPRCQHINYAGSFFCYQCGKFFVALNEPAAGLRTGKRKLPLKSRIDMPGGSVIKLQGDPVFIERSDFDSTLPNDLLMCISRQHVLITYSRGKYYVQDYGRDGKGSTNHTRLNGTDIFGKKKKALKDGDKIELAGQPELTMTFRIELPENGAN